MKNFHSGQTVNIPYAVWETAYQCLRSIKLKAGMAYHKAGESHKKT